MASQINPNNIDVTYPIAGQDNDTQGFRTNFTNIKNNFLVASQEITNIQSSLAAALATVPNLTTVPVSSSALGTAGQIAYDSTHLYVCVAANTWVRTTLATWLPGS
jgi:hypothetical protein